jgi:cell division protease FtsH
MKKDDNFQLWPFMTLIALYFLMQGLLSEPANQTQLAYSEFEKLARDGRVEKVTISGSTLSGTFRQPVDGHDRFRTSLVDPALAARLEGMDVEIENVPPNPIFGALVSMLAPLILFLGIYFFLFRRSIGAGGGAISLGKSGAKVFVEQETGVTFDDVAGVDEAKLELMEIIDFLKNPGEYERLGAHVPKGVLLVGPPGTGKTLLARAVAGQAGVPFFSISGSQFVEVFVGVGAARVRDLFNQARKMAPAIIFVDELDALGRARSLGQMVGNDEREQTLNQLLAELDGFDPSSGIVLLAATNRPEILDPALLRAGRFDRQVLVDKPDKTGRVAILKVHTRKIHLGPDVDLEPVAAMTTGFTGADLANLVNEAAILATRRRADAVGMEDFSAAIERIVAGLEKRNRLLNEKERGIVAHHEMGHAIIALALPGTDRVHKVSIIPRGVGALGYTIQRPTEDRYLMTREELVNKICVLLGGRAAEKLVFDEVSTGAADDLFKATDIARSMVERFGMDETLGPLVFQEDRPLFLDNSTVRSRSISEATAERLDAATSNIIRDAFQRTTAILSDNRDLLEKCSQDLLKKETLDEDEISEISKALKKSAASTKGSL